MSKFTSDKVKAYEECNKAYITLLDAMDSLWESMTPKERRAIDPHYDTMFFDVPDFSMIVNGELVESNN